MRISSPRCVATRTSVDLASSKTTRSSSPCVSSPLIAGSASIVLAITDPVLKGVTALLMAVGAVTLMLIKTCPDCGREDNEDPT